MIPRVAFTIAYNAAHHLLHRDWADRLINQVDLWVIADGLCNSGGSTYWCHKLKRHACSVDTIADLCDGLSEQYCGKLVFIPPRNNRAWKSKDDKVNACLDAIRSRYQSAYLWQIDADEQWDPDIMAAAERLVDGTNKKSCAFCCNFFVGPGLIASGVAWGGSAKWRRMWKWEGERFLTHEPPVLDLLNERIVDLKEYSDRNWQESESMEACIRAPAFDHYAYYFEQDVAFKQEYYQGHEHILRNWRRIQKMNRRDFPIELSELFRDCTYDVGAGQISTYDEG